MQRMKASCLIQPERYEIVETTVPAIQPGEVLVRIQRAAICGSDVHIFHNVPPQKKYPSITGFSGHEAVGIVERSTDPAWPAGQRVLVVPPSINAFAEFVTVPSTQLVSLPEDTSWDKLVIGQQLGTVIFCLRKASNLMDKSVAILGQGPAGLMFAALARHMGARRIIGIDLVPSRLEVARLMGADEVIDARGIDVGRAVADLTNGQLADVAIEAVGLAGTIDTVSSLVRIGGELIFFGIPPTGQMSFDFERFFRRYARTITSAGAPAEPGFPSFRLAMDMIRRGTIDVTPLISHVLPLDDIQKAFHLADTKEDRAVKIVLNPTAK